MNIYMIATEDFKVFDLGQTKRSFEERHKDGDWAKFHNFCKAYGLKTVLLGWWEDVDILDTEVHEWLVTLPTLKKHAEWFEHDVDLHVLKDQIEKKYFIKDSREKVKFNPRPYQAEFIKKANKEYCEFLLWAKCRAGKSVMVLSHILDRKFKISLIVSRSKSPEQSWKEDSENFIDFDHFRYICLADKNWKEQLEYWSQVEGIQVILWSTISGLLNRIQDISHVDFLCYDECHLGYGAKEWKEVLSNLNTVPCMYVSGTAFKLAPDFSQQNTFIYTYFDEQLDVQRGVFHRGKMQVILAKYDSEEYRKIYGDCPDAMKNIFAVEDGKFVHESLVIDFVHNYLSTQRHIRNPKDRLLNDTQHAYLLMPSAEACVLIADYIKDYSPLVATGKAKVNAKMIRKHVAENAKTMIITRWANVLGVTVEEIDTVINCSEGKSTEFWIQGASRGGSGDHDYKVIEFSPQKALESVRLSYSIACDSNPELLNYQSTEFVAISEWADKFVQMTQDQINQITACDIGDTRSLIASAAYHIDMEKLNEFEINMNLKSSTSDLVKSAEVNDNGANGKTNKKVEGKTPATKNEELSRKKESIKSILEAIPLTILYEMRNGKNVNSVENVLKSDYYISSTGDTQNVIKRSLDDGILDYNRLMHRISQVSTDIAIAMKNSFADALDELSVSCQEHRSIPYTIFSEMIGDYVQPHHKILVICDPSGSQVAYLIEKCGVPAQNIWVWESCQTHLFRVECVDSAINVVSDLEGLMGKIQFDGVISNPPYSINSHKTGKSAYGDFAELGYNLLKEGGYGIMVHPPGLRKPTDKRHYLMRDVQVEKLSIHSSKEGVKVFNANTSYDWYSYRKEERTGPTQVRFQGSEEWVDVDFRDYPFVPNHSLDLLQKYLNTDASIPRLNAAVGRAPRFKDKKNPNKFDPTVYFEGCYVNVNKTTPNGEPEFVYDKKPQPYYQQKKVIFKEGGNFYPYYDDGKYGVTDNSMYILVDSEEEGHAIVEFLNSEEANTYREACQLSGGFRTVCSMLNVIPNPYYVKKAG